MVNLRGYFIFGTCSSLNLDKNSQRSNNERPPAIIIIIIIIALTLKPLFDLCGIPSAGSDGGPFNERDGRFARWINDNGNSNGLN